MEIHLSKSATFGLAALSLIGLCSSRAPAQSHPQEVLDLIHSYEALAMKVRPLQDRVAVASSASGSSARFQPEGVPVRAQAATATTGGDAPAESRVTERLRHRDRAASSDDDYKRLIARLSAPEQKARSELERIRAPGFGTPREDENGGVRFGDARRGARPPGVDERAIMVARRALSELEREYAALERQVSAIEGR